MPQARLSDNFDDTYSLAWTSLDMASILRQGKTLISCAADGSLCHADASSFFERAQAQLQDLTFWAQEKRSRLPTKSVQLSQDHQGTMTAYPKRIDVYNNTSQATTCNIWRNSKIIILKVMIQVLQTLSAKSNPTQALAYFDQIISHGDAIRELIDDICASIPFYMNPMEPETMVKYYPHAPGEHVLPLMPGPSLIKSVNQYAIAVQIAFEVEQAPSQQRMWLQQYLMVLAKDPTGITPRHLMLDSYLGSRHGACYSLLQQGLHVSRL